MVNEGRGKPKLAVDIEIYEIRDLCIQQKIRMCSTVDLNTERTSYSQRRKMRDEQSINSEGHMVERSVASPT